MRGWTRRRWTITVAVGLAVVAGGATWLLWPEDETPPPRQREYRETTACLLTDDRGLNGEPASAVWAGMQDASLDTRIQVQHLAIVGPQTTDNGVTFFNTLAMQRCTVIVAAGPAPVAAMAAGYGQFPGITYVAVGGDTAGKPLTKVDARNADEIRSAVKEIVVKAI
jgi:hypothetical protein